ncbi:hypothetical protein QFZ34_002104 [Phyllobacterium ifriqiyense]|uniref:Uncharacterized protein n=1 Tax=Phyllobacterium ifriqiyense TaxID=314238 RepID=A0ABU0S845_9HYPH|nr:hypothetical protein [Phyllobacterium ifriqiyense]MDQ0996922.1 hypothetical protein [Phyllobacterium ifriqiyense]
MTKHEHPAFKMVIENARLVPATAYDEERLQSYRRGTKVCVRFTEEKDRIFVRKWWAILGKAVKECQTPWQTKDQASEAIKLSLGIVNLSKTVGGAFMQYPKSLTELTDPELEEAVEQMMAIIQHITGVDPADWRKEIADLGEEEQNTSAGSPQAAGVSGEVELGSLSQSNQTADEAVNEPGDDLVSSGEELPGSDNQDESDHPFDEAEWLKAFAKVIVAAIGPDEAVVVDASKGQFVDGLSEDTSSRARTIVNYARQACRGEIEPDDAKEIIAGKARMESVKELV